MIILNNDIFEGLKALADSSFPKQCASCGKRYETAEQFLKETEDLNTKSGLKNSVDDDGSSIVEAYRNCICGSTLMDFFTDRRDLSEKGLYRRKKFGEMLDALVEAGEDKEQMRVELLKILRGENSDILKKYRRKKLV